MYSATSKSPYSNSPCSPAVSQSRAKIMKKSTSSQSLKRKRLGSYTPSYSTGIYCAKLQKVPSTKSTWTAKRMTKQRHTKNSTHSPSVSFLVVESVTMFNFFRPPTPQNTTQFLMHWIEEQGNHSTPNHSTPEVLSLNTFGSMNPVMNLETMESCRD